jgi:Uma2 family endonuclease
MSMSTATLVSLDEYLSTNYRPDYDYVDGELVERNVGEREHSFVQMRLAGFFYNAAKRLGVSAWPEMRLQVSPTRFRVPDLCVYRGRGPQDRYFRTPPFLCIEILSPEDRVSRMEEKLNDYFNFGVDCVWVIDPSRRAARIHTRDASHPVGDGLLTTANPDIVISFEEIFSDLD